MGGYPNQGAILEIIVHLDALESVSSIFDSVVATLNGCTDICVATATRPLLAPPLNSILDVPLAGSILAAAGIPVRGLWTSVSSLS